MSNMEKFVNLKRYQFHDDLINYVKGMTGEKRAMWRLDSNLGRILNLSDVDLQWNMFEALVKLWDPKEMTFKFCNSELTPSLEEFAQITSLPLECDLIIPETKPGYESTASTFFAPKKNKREKDEKPIGKIGKDIEISYLLNLATRDPTMLSTEQKLKSQNAIDLAVVGSFLFSNEKHRVDMRLCGVVEAMKIGNRTVVPLILGEMLKSLNYCKNSRSNSSLALRGPVAILQIWVFEHFAEVFNLKNVTKDPGNYIIYDYCRKQEQVRLKSKQDWYCVLYFTKENQIIWRCFLFKPRPMLRIGPPAKTSFPLPCMEECISYNPIKAIKQLGFKSRVEDHILPSHNYKGVGLPGKATNHLKCEWRTTNRTAEELGLELEFSVEPPTEEDWFDKYMATKRPTRKIGSTSG